MSSPPNDRWEATAPEPSLAAWLTEYGPGLRRYFEKRVTPTDAEDLVQEVFLSMQVRGHADTVSNVKGYLFRVAANVLARRRFQLTNRPLSGAAEPVEEISPERLLIGKQTAHRVIAALESLPPRCREALLLHRFEEKTYAAVARRMGVSVSAVEQLITRALRQITAALEEKL